MTLLSCWDVLRFSARSEVELSIFAFFDFHGIVMENGENIPRFRQCPDKALSAMKAPTILGVFQVGASDCLGKLREFESFTRLFSVSF